MAGKTARKANYSSSTSSLRLTLPLACWRVGASMQGHKNKEINRKNSPLSVVLRLSSLDLRLSLGVLLFPGFRHFRRSRLARKVIVRLSGGLLDTSDDRVILDGQPAFGASSL